MPSATPQCPHCNSQDTLWKAKAGQWECRDCEHRFDAPPPAAEDIPDPSASAEDAYRSRARKLADSGQWVQPVIDAWPAPIAFTYALLRRTLQDGKIDASALVLRDFAELLARFSALAMICDVLQNGPPDSQTKALTQLFAKPLAMGDWVGLADTWAMWIEASPQHEQQWLTRPIAQMWRSGKNQTDLGSLMTARLVKWRNEVIGHGVRGDDLSTLMNDLEEFLGSGSGNLHDALRPHQSLADALFLADDKGRILAGASLIHEEQNAGRHPMTPAFPLFLQDPQGRAKLPLRAFLAARRCQVCGQVETFHFDSAKPKKLIPDFRVLNYERGHALSLPGSSDTVLLEDFRRSNRPTEMAEADFDSEALPAQVVRMLDEASISQGYLSPNYLRDALHQYISAQLDQDHGGLYWLRAPAHVGKSTFVAGLDPDYASQFKESPLLDGLAVATFYIRREYQYHLAQFADTVRDKIKRALNLATGAQKLPELDTEHPTPEKFAGFLQAFQRLGNRPLLVVIDGLDELADGRPSILDLLPTAETMPPEVYLLLTSRPLADCPQWMQPTLHALLGAPGQEIGLENADYRKLLEQYASRVWEKSKAATLKNKPGVDLEHIVPRLMQASDARFLYFRFLVDRLAEGDIAADDLDALTTPENLLPKFVAALRTRYANTPYGELIDRTLLTLALAEDAFNRKMRDLPALARDVWQGLPMAVLCDLVEHTPRMTPRLAWVLIQLKPLLGTWRGASDGPRYRLGIKGLEDVLRDQDPNAMPALAQRLVGNLLDRQSEWLRAPAEERGDAKEYRGAGLDWVLCHIDGLKPKFDFPTSKSRPENPIENAVLASLIDELDTRSETLNAKTVIQMAAAAFALYGWADTDHEKDEVIKIKHSLKSLFLRKIKALYDIGNLKDVIESQNDFNLIIDGLKFTDDLLLSVSNFGLFLGNAERALGLDDDALENYVRFANLLKSKIDEFGMESDLLLAQLQCNAANLLQEKGEDVLPACQEIYRQCYNSLIKYLDTPHPKRLDLISVFSGVFSGICLQIADFKIKLNEFEGARVFLDLNISLLPGEIENLERINAATVSAQPPYRISASSLLTNLAHSYILRGVVFLENNDAERAHADQIKSIDILLRLQRNGDFTFETEHLLARVYDNFGRALKIEKKDAEALKCYDEAISILTTLRTRMGDEFPPKMAVDLAHYHVRRAAVRSETEAAESALTDYTKAIALWEDLRARLKAQFTPEMAHDLALAYLRRTVARRDGEDAKAARADYDQAIALLEDFRARPGGQFTSDMANTLACAYDYRGRSLFASGDEKQALNDYERAIDILKIQRTQSKQQLSHEMVDSLATAFADRGEVLLRLQEVDHAAADINQALFLWNDLERTMGSEFPQEWREKRDTVLHLMRK